MQAEKGSETASFDLHASLASLEGSQRRILLKYIDGDRTSI
jgi:hypothetical protein